ncbi:Cytochrome c1-2, heme protein, mitochondrial, partial [Cyphomyrmex costatus]
KRHLREVLIFCFKWKKTAAEAHRMLVEFMVIVLLPIKHAENSFDAFKVIILNVEDKERSGGLRAFENKELQALVDEDPCRTQKQLAEVLNCAQSVISKKEVFLHRIVTDDIEDGPDEEGNYYMRPGRLSDLLPLPYPNEEAAKAANFGAYPPDLTYIICARRNGRNYLFSLLTGWREPPAGIFLSDQQYFNIYFPGNVMSMAQMLSTGVVEYDDGTPSTISQMAKDIVEFLSWTSSQEFDVRKRMFIKAVGICILLLASVGHYMRFVWSHHRSRQIAYIPKKKY